MLVKNLLRNLAVCKLSHCVALPLENTSICYRAADPECPSNSKPQLCNQALKCLCNTVAAAACYCSSSNLYAASVLLLSRYTSLICSKLPLELSDTEQTLTLCIAGVYV